VVVVVDDVLVEVRTTVSGTVDDSIEVDDAGICPTELLDVSTPVSVAQPATTTNRASTNRFTSAPQ
jgi:hypothetical protein